MKRLLIALSALAYLSLVNVVFAQSSGCDAACEAARKIANPLADIRAIMTDNTIAYKTGTNDDDSYNFQVQPVYSLPVSGGNLVLRGVVPIQGVAAGAVLPPGIGTPTPNPSLEWGFGDSTVQAFYAPTPSGDIALGYGLQVSLPTHTKNSLKGAGWGGGPAFVIFGQSGDLSWGGVLAHMWGENNFSTTILQPILIYGLGGGWYLGYNNVISYNWKAASEADAWQIPLGLTVGKTIITNEEKGTAMDLSLGFYDLNRTPSGGADRQLKFGVSFFF